MTTQREEEPVEAAARSRREELRSSWDEQQAGHLPDRELRFGLLLDYVEQLAGPPRRVLDLCCGPGSLTERVLARFPAAEVVAVDIDPLLLDLARDRFAGDHRVSVLARQLAAPDWDLGLTTGFDAVVTATATHWFPADALAEVYAGVARLLRPGGVFANADHVPIAEPVLRAAADRLHEQHLRTVFAETEDCDGWYERAYADPQYAGWWTERQQVFAHWAGELLEREGWHVDLLRRNGFERAGAVWRRGNDALVIAVRG
ncbi:Methyltransferase type 12 [Kribbella flavida DSM 17836]|uniref:Methyltransferase type 12 n=1 Tax=Kribbella flavida (strain DSM 17836 / JCM 10339 / NBRC 14399) TaxID=479435 RepID=D2PXH0_KRIFD|nr:class I SAM-dependent methyltransferase [Kribbella flavida]ADB29818.1 Methyltransferase type 12 [Kribbella flavida DSM 17836]